MPKPDWRKWIEVPNGDMPTWRRVLLTVAWIALLACLLALFMIGFYAMIGGVMA